MEKYGYERNEVKRVFDKKKRWKQELIDAMIQELLNGQHDPYPYPTDRNTMLVRVFDGFAENMPELKR